MIEVRPALVLFLVRLDVDGSQSKLTIHRCLRCLLKVEDLSDLRLWLTNKA